ncbi:Cupin_2 domain-containing protein [Desulfovibrionales bacterium]
MTSQFLRQRRVIQPRGELALIEDGLFFYHLAWFSIEPGDDYFRGNHVYHKKVERFYMVAGRVLLDYIDLDTKKETDSIEIEPAPGSWYPRLGHRFRAIKRVEIVEYYESIYD